MTTNAKPPRAHPRRFAVAWRVLVLFGVLLAVTGGVLAYRLGSASASALKMTPFTTPAETTVHLTPGTWVIYEETGSTSRVGPVTSTVNGPVRMDATDVRVADRGVPVPATNLRANETITDDGAIYTGAVTFRVSHEGLFSLDVAGDQGRVRLAPDIVQAFSQSAWWFVAAGAALVGVLVSGGLTLGSLRRQVLVGSPVLPAAPGSARHQPALPPPGWYPDPRGTGGTLWWDGRVWRVPRSPGQPPDDDPHPVGPPL